MENDHSAKLSKQQVGCQ